MDTSTKGPAFLAQAEQWIDSQPELLVLFLYSRAAGRKDYFLIRSVDSFQQALASLPPSTSVILLPDAEFPLRGIADKTLLERALALLPEDSEFLILRLETDGVAWDGVGHGELAEQVAELDGEQLAVGLYPPWYLDTADIVEAIVPDADGVVRRGIY